MVVDGRLGPLNEFPGLAAVGTLQKGLVFDDEDVLLTCRTRQGTVGRSIPPLELRARGSGTV